MKELFNFKNKVRDIIRKYEEIIFPILRLIWCYLVFTNVHTMFHYLDLFDRQIVIFLLAVLCAVLPDGFLVFAAGAVIGVNCFIVNLEVGLAFSVVFMVMYCMYIRFFPKYAYAIFLVPICYSLGMPYLAPVLIVVISGIGGALPAAFGVMLYHFAGCVSEIQVQLTTAVDDSKVEVLEHFVKNFLKDNEMYMVMIVFALAVVLASIIYRFSFPFSHYVAVAAAGILTIILSMIVGSVMKQTPDMSSILGGSLIGVLIGLVMEALKGVLDFPHSERVQFEDDDYYYYVKAVPKLDKPKEQPKKKRPAPKKPAKGGAPKKPNGPGRPNPNGPNRPNPNGPNRPNPNRPNRPNPNGPNRPSPNGPNRPNPNGPDRPNPNGSGRPNPNGPSRPDPGELRLPGEKDLSAAGGMRPREEQPSRAPEKELQIPSTKAKKQSIDEFEDLG